MVHNCSAYWYIFGLRLTISLNIKIKELLGVYSEPSRDDRFHTASVVYLCKADGEPIGADDAKEAMVVNLADLNLDELVFDHGNILRDYLNKHHPTLSL